MGDNLKQEWIDRRIKIGFGIKVTRDKRVILQMRMASGWTSIDTDNHTAIEYTNNPFFRSILQNQNTPLLKSNMPKGFQTTIYESTTREELYVHNRCYQLSSYNIYTINSVIIWKERDIFSRRWNDDLFLHFVTEHLHSNNSIWLQLHHIYLEIIHYISLLILLSIQSINHFRCSPTLFHFYNWKKKENKINNKIINRERLLLSLHLFIYSHIPQYPWLQSRFTQYILLIYWQQPHTTAILLNYHQIIEINHLYHSHSKFCQLPAYFIWYNHLSFILIPVARTRHFIFSITTYHCWLLSITFVIVTLIVIILFCFQSTT